MIEYRNNTAPPLSVRPGAVDEKLPLVGVGLIPEIGEPVDGINGLISLGRGIM